MIKGWDEGVIQMSLGGIAALNISAEESSANEYKWRLVQSQSHELGCGAAGAGLETPPTPNASRWRSGIWGAQNGRLQALGS